MSITPFEELLASTATSVVYSNININLRKLFNNTVIFKLDPPLTKKKKNINKKALFAPYGRIISIQHGLYIRGIRMSKKKKYWCPDCQKMEIKDDDEKEVHTVEEHVRPMSDEAIKAEAVVTGTQKLHFVCKDCNGEFEIQKLKKIVPFLNQVTISLSLGNIMVNVMVFADNFKIAGNKTISDAYESIMILWENYITQIEGCWRFRRFKNEGKKVLKGKDNSSKEKDPEISLSEDETPKIKDAHFLFDLVMENVDFNLDFSINKVKLNELMNSPTYKSRVHLSQCETTSATHVNIKMFAEKPENFQYDMLVYKNGSTENPYFTKVSEKLYAKKKKAKPSYITFIVFSSAEIILTGRYKESMKDQYEFFIDTLRKNRSKVEEVISKPKMSIREYLKSLETEDGNALTFKDPCF